MAPDYNKDQKGTIILTTTHLGEVSALGLPHEDAVCPWQQHPEASRTSALLFRWILLLFPEKWLSDLSRTSSTDIGGE